MSANKRHIPLGGILNVHNSLCWTWSCLSHTGVNTSEDYVTSTYAHAFPMRFMRWTLSQAREIKRSSFPSSCRVYTYPMFKHWHRTALYPVLHICHPRPSKSTSPGAAPFRLCCDYIHAHTHLMHISNYYFPTVHSNFIHIPLSSSLDAREQSIQDQHIHTPYPDWCSRLHRRWQRPCAAIFDHCTAL